MKLILAIGIFLISHDIFAGPCANINGNFVTGSSQSYIAELQYSQSECQNFSLTYAVKHLNPGTGATVSVEQYPSVVMPLDGTKTSDPTACAINLGCIWTFEATPNFIIKKTSLKEWYYANGRKLHCEFTTSHLFLDASGNLNEMVQDAYCPDDKFSGGVMPIPVVYKRAP